MAVLTRPYAEGFSSKEYADVTYSWRNGQRTWNPHDAMLHGWALPARLRLQAHRRRFLQPAAAGPGRAGLLHRAAAVDAGPLQPRHLRRHGPSGDPWRRPGHE